MKDCTVFVYNSYKDPLLQATLFHYIKRESENNRFRFHLITYEQEEFYIPKEEKLKIAEELRKSNIYWYPLRWHSGSFKLLKKLYDFIVAFLLVHKLRRKHRVSVMISLGTVAGSFAYLLARFFGMVNYIYQYERHSEFLVDFKIWSETSLSFRLLNYLELLSSRNSQILATGTTHMMQRLEQENTEATLYYLPSCVDEVKFQFDEKSRSKIRAQIGIKEDRQVVIYMGKFGGIYFGLDEMCNFFYQWHLLDSNSFFMILSPEDNVLMSEKLVGVGIQPNYFHVDSVSHSLVPAYLSASDLGIVAVPSLSSQKYRSPIKVGEYLCCGLPYLVGHNISDDDKVAREKNVGVVIDSYDEIGLKNAYPSIENLMKESKDDLRRRCREAGIRYRGLSMLSETSDEIFKELYN